MRTLGKTPLYRARNIEKLLGVDKVYLKLEGSNPFGHKYDRITGYLVDNAVRQKKDGILVEGPPSFVQSMILAANQRNVSVHIPSRKGRRIYQGDYGTIPILQKIAVEYRAVFSAACQERNLYNAYIGNKNVSSSIMALEAIGDEIISKLGGGVTHVYLQLSYGLGLKGLYNSFERQIIEKKTEVRPELICCTAQHGNEIFEAYERDFTLKENRSLDTVKEQFCKRLHIQEESQLEAAMEAVYDSFGQIMTIPDELLVRCVNDLRNKEGIKVTKAEAYSLAGLYMKHMQNRLDNGVHVVVLNDGTSHARVEQVKPGEWTRDELIAMVMEFLEPYGDSKVETGNAIDNALEKGAVFIASQGGVPQGVAVVVHMGFSDFIPTYHLGYIGTHEGNKGKGIASFLLKEVVTFTGGNVSLHVDTDNKRATQVYAKLGFKHCYNRMIYKG